MEERRVVHRLETIRWSYADDNGENDDNGGDGELKLLKCQLREKIIHFQVERLCNKDQPGCIKNEDPGAAFSFKANAGCPKRSFLDWTAQGQINFFFSIFTCA